MSLFRMSGGVVHIPEGAVLFSSSNSLQDIYSLSVLISLSASFTQYGIGCILLADMHALASALNAVGI